MATPRTAAHLVVASLLLLAACGVESPSATAPDLTERVGLPPTLAELREGENTPQPAVDPAAWQLPEQDLPGDPDWLRLFFSQDNRGELDPCGCPGSPSGGMARRLTLVKEIRALLPDAVLVEGPTCLSRAVLGTEVVRGEHRARARLLVELLAATAPEAFFPGNADFEVVPPKELAQLAAAQGLPLVATNLEPGIAGGAFAPYLLIERGSRRVLLLGLVAAADNEGVRALVPTVDAVRATEAAIEGAIRQHGPVDLVLGFTDAGVRELAEWRSRGLDLDVLVAPPVPGEPSVPSWRDRRLILRSEPQGRAFGRLDVAFGATRGRSLSPQPDKEWALRQVADVEQLYLERVPLLRRLEREAEQQVASPPALAPVGMDGRPQQDLSRDPEAIQGGLAEARLVRRAALDATTEMQLSAHLAVGSLVLVDPRLDEDLWVEQRLATFHGARIAELSAALRAREPAPANEQYGGQDLCISCHAEEVAQWARGPHAKAWLHLSQRGETRNSSCLACHTTGFGEPGGFLDAAVDDRLLNVQCEACHGPMRLHAQQAQRVGVRPSGGVPVTVQTCRRCHDSENSPNFDCERYLGAIGHGPGAPQGKGWGSGVCP